ncbi:MAG: beta-ketoacyl-[acyl-carrier-protein] synthase family protein [Candidatus Omnitrophota bacterium]
MSEKINNRRVVVTGLGVVSSIGIGWQEFWQNLLAGKSGISEVDYFDTSKYDRKYAGQVKNFRPQDFISPHKIKYMGRASQMALAAARMAVEDAGLKKTDIVPERSGVCVGTTMGEGQVIESCVQDDVLKGRTNIERSRSLLYPANSVVFNIAKEFNIKGPAHIFGNACAAGSFALGRGSDLITTGNVDMMIVGGSDPLSRIAFTGFHRLISISEEPVCRPFDQNRSGMIPGEGAGVLILEEKDHAVARGATIYAEVLGYGCSADAHHMTQPDYHGTKSAISKALRFFDIFPDDIDYISAHGTATPENDRAECRAFHEIFGRRIKNIPVSSIKSMLGHTMGAASALESIACCLSLHDQKIPPTINYQKPDPECEIDCVPNVSRSYEVKVVLNNSLAFGGSNSSLIFKRHKY